MFNRLIEAKDGDSTIVNTYNGEGLRVSKTTNGNTLQYFYEYGKIVLEVDGNGTETARNVYGTNLISRTVDEITLTYLYNGHADVVALVDESGTQVAGYYYDSWGNHVEDGTWENAGVNNPIRYRGYEYDSQTDLYYLKSRFYDSGIARFMQEDTYYGNPNDPLSLNLYAYCANNPVNYVDPLRKRMIRSC